MIVAVADNGVIGANNKLPWHIKADMQHFRELTLNKVVIMGRRTFTSIGRPLPERTNIVLSKRFGGFDNCYWFDNDKQARIFAELDTPAMVIGGASVYRQFLPWCTKLHLTRVHLKPEGDTFFPEFEHLYEIQDAYSMSEDGIRFEFETWERIYK